MLCEKFERSRLKHTSRLELFKKQLHLATGLVLKKAAYCSQSAPNTR